MPSQNTTSPDPIRPMKKVHLEEGLQLTRPIFGLTLAVLLGTAAGFFLGHVLLWLIIGSILWIGAALSYKSDHSLRLIICFSTLVATQAAWIHDRNQASIDRLEATIGTPFTMHARVANDVQTIYRKRGAPYCSFSADDAYFATDGEAIHGVNLRINFYGATETFPKPGETWSVTGKLYARSFGYRRTFSTNAKTSHLLHNRAVISSEYGFSSLRDRLARHLQLGLTHAQALPIQTMVLGTRQKLPSSDRRLYADAGIIHIFAISGMHVGIIAGLLFLSLRHFKVSFRLKGLIITPFLIIYLILTGMPPSAVRACIMALIYFNAALFWRRADTGTALALTALVVFLFSPGWIANIGALLSFGVMASILLLYAPFNYLLNVYFGSLRTLSDLFTYNKSPWHLKIRRQFAALFALMLSAWVGSLPLSLFFFGRLSIAGLILNLFIPCLMTLILSLAMISTFSGFIFEPLSIILNRINAFIINRIHDASAFLVRDCELFIVLDNPPGLTLTLILEMCMIGFALYLRQVVLHHRQKDSQGALGSLYSSRG